MNQALARPWATARQSAIGRLGFVAAVVAGAHGALVSGIHGDGAPMLRPATTHAVQVRMIVVPQHLNVPTEPDTRGTESAAPHTRPAATSPRGFRGRDPTASAGPGVASELLSIASVGDPYLDFLPRSALSAGPSPLHPVAIDFPAFVGAAERYKAAFDVLVDESGGVVHVLSIDASLPPILVHSVRSAFQPIKFSPGMLDGRPARSRFRIEVTFDSQPDQS